MKTTKVPRSLGSCGRHLTDSARSNTLLNTLSNPATFAGRLVTCGVVALLLSVDVGSADAGPSAGPSAGTSAGTSAGAAAEERGTHLFILSGQSNMTGRLKEGFTRGVEAYDENTHDENTHDEKLHGEKTRGEKTHDGKSQHRKNHFTIVHHSKSGRGIRFWDKDYKFPDNYQFPGKGVPSERTKQQHGEVYGPLIEKVRDACKDKSFDTVTFVWMQGESDGMRGLGAVYEESFLRLLGRLKSDLDRKEINFVIGRISDYGMNTPNAVHWREVRDVQVRLAEKHEQGAWINTDDLNGDKDDLHYPPDKCGMLGERFAVKALELIRTKSAGDASEIQTKRSTEQVRIDEGEDSK